MVLADDRILEYIHENETGAPTEMSENNVRYSKQYISQRMKKLRTVGLLDHLGNGVHSITGKGEGYLEGEYDVQTGEWREDDEEESDVSDGAREAS